MVKAQEQEPVGGHKWQTTECEQWMMNGRGWAQTPQMDAMATVGAALATPTTVTAATANNNSGWAMSMNITDSAGDDEWQHQQQEWQEQQPKVCHRYTEGWLFPHCTQSHRHHTCSWYTPILTRNSRGVK